MMIRWQHQQKRVGVTVDDLQGSEGNRGGGIAPGGLQYDRTGLFPDFTKLLGHQKTVGFVADHNSRRGLNACQTQLGLLQHGPGAANGQELFGPTFPGDRPEPAADAP